MSLISRNSQIARGIPAAPAGQPGHGNLMTTHFNGNGCWLSVGQSVDTLKATTGFWYFRDSNAPRTGNAEYQSGLALSMNIDYEKFIDSRFAMNIYKLAAIGSTTGRDGRPFRHAPQGIHADRHEDRAQSQPVLYGSLVHALQAGTSGPHGSHQDGG